MPNRQSEIGNRESEAEPLVLRLDADVAYQPLLNGMPQTCGMRSGCVTLEAGKECGQHSTKAHEEVLVVLRGAGIVRLDGHDDLLIQAGDLVYIPPHTGHNVVNAQAEALRYVYVVAPAADWES